MDEAPRREKKFGLVEVIIVTIVIFVLGIADAIPLIGPLFDFGFTQMYLGMKGVASTYQFIMLGSNSVTEIISSWPGFGWIGDIADIIVFWIIVLNDWFAPEVVKKGLERAGQVAQAVEGSTAGVGGVEEGGVATGGNVTEAGAPATTQASAQGAETKTPTENGEAKGKSTATEQLTPEEERPWNENLQEKLLGSYETIAGEAPATDEDISDFAKTKRE